MCDTEPNLEALLVAGKLEQVRRGQCDSVFGDMLAAIARHRNVLNALEDQIRTLYQQAREGKEIDAETFGELYVSVMD